MPRLGIISDTHNNPHPRVFQVFAGVDRILHAGDICHMDVMLALHRVAPVTAVCSRNDGSDVRRALAESHLETIDGWRVMLRHDIGQPASYRRRIEAADNRGVMFPDVVISGNSQKAWCEYIDGIWFINPGRARLGPFHTRPTCGVLSLEGASPPHVEIISLESH